MEGRGLRGAELIASVTRDKAGVSLCWAENHVTSDNSLSPLTLRHTRHCYFQGQGNHPYWYRFILTADIGQGQCEQNSYNVLLNVHVMRLILCLYDNENKNPLMLLCVFEIRFNIELV